MKWAITKTRDEDTWFAEYAKVALSCSPPALPARRQRLGAVNISWFECEPGIAFINTQGGNLADRSLARQYMAAQLAGHGIKQAEYTFDQDDDDEFDEDAYYEEKYGYRPLNPFENADMSRLIEEVRHPKYRGEHYETWDEDEEEPQAQERPVIFNGQRFYLGEPNAYHWDMIENHPELQGQFSPGGNNEPTNDEFAMGRINPLAGTVVWPTPGKYRRDQLTDLASHVWPNLYDESEDMGFENVFSKVHKTAQWTDIMAKAKRLIQSGQVRILRNGYNDIVGDVTGDHGRYQTEITRADPESRAITGWQCDCPWDQFAWQRTRQWKKYEGRPCAHVLATYWQALSTPVDEDAHPQQQMPTGPAGMPQPPADMSPTPQPMPAQPAQQPLPGMPGPVTGQPPQPGVPPEIIPPFPMEGEPMGPQVSIPGAKPQTPLNPIQYPGGTFSSVQEWDWPMKTAAFENGTMVQTRFDDQGVWEGRSEGAGEYSDVPAGSVGEVLGQDPSGMIQVLFMNEATGVQEHGRMQPWGISAWYLPSELVLRPDLKQPGPAVKRRV